MTIDYVLFDPGNVTPIVAMEDKCHYSNWTSCSYFCGDEKEEFSYRALLDDSPKARGECPIPKKPCNESVVCTGNIYKPEQSEASFLFFYQSRLSSESGRKPTSAVRVAGRREGCLSRELARPPVHTNHAQVSRLNRP